MRVEAKRVLALTRAVRMEVALDHHAWHRRSDSPDDLIGRSTEAPLIVETAAERVFPDAQDGYACAVRWLRFGIATTVLAVLLSACGGTASRTPAASSVTVSPHPTSSTTWPRQSVPGAAFVIDAGGIKEISTGDGHVVRSIAALPAGQAPGWIRADRAHGRIFFGTEDCDQTSWIWMVPLAGGSPTKIAEGFAASISPDGKRIAFPRLLDGCVASAIVVRDLADGSEVVWDGASTVGGGIGAVAWAPDGRRIAYESLRGHELFVLDTADRKAALGGHPMFVGRLGDAAVAGGVWSLAVIRPCPQPKDEFSCPAAVDIVNGDTAQVMRTYPAVTDLAAVNLDDAGTGLLLERTAPGATGRIAAQYGERSVSPLARGVGFDW